MKSTWSTWLLAGALAASLSWNFLPARSAPPGAAAQACLQSAELTLDDLGLDAEQKRALDELCRSPCADSQSDAARAQEKLALLREALAAETLDEAHIAALVREITTLRERSLAGCVESVRAVRSILDADQLAKLVETCQPAAMLESGAPSER